MMHIKNMWFWQDARYYVSFAAKAIKQTTKHETTLEYWPLKGSIT